MFPEGWSYLEGSNDKLTSVQPAVAHTLHHPRAIFQDKLLPLEFIECMAVAIRHLTVSSRRIAVHDGILALPVGSKLGVRLGHLGGDGFESTQQMER